MNPTLKYNFIKLNNSVLPQVFIKKDDKIIYFDKINPDEARFCIKSKNNEESFEVFNGVGIITSNGEMYVADIKDYTLLKKYSPSGKAEKEINIEGKFYDFKLSSFGELICLGNINGKSVIKIFSRDYNEICTIYPKDIFFGSCIFSEDDNIYIAGIDDKGNYEIIKINYIGNMLLKWNLKIKLYNKIIVKIERYKNYFIMLASGKKESLILYDINNKRYKEIHPMDFDIENFLDFNIYENAIFILGGKYLFDVNIIDLMFYIPRVKIKKFFNKNELYFYYVMFNSKLSKEIIVIYKYTPLFIFIFYLISFILKINIDFLYLIYFLPILNFIISTFLSFSVFLKKANRIEQLLNISQLKDINSIKFLPLHISLTLFCILKIINYPYMPYILVCLLLYFVFYKINKIAVNIIKYSNDDIVIALLKSDDLIFKGYMEDIVKCLKQKNSEKILIEVVSKEDINLLVPLKWQKSRNCIIKSYIKISENLDRIETLLDFSSRDIKYSRISILMDYICFIKNKVKVKSIQITILDKD